MLQKYLAKRHVEMEGTSTVLLHHPETCQSQPFWEILYTLWLFNIAMENGPFIVDFPIKTSIYEGFSMAMLVITRW